MSDLLYLEVNGVTIAYTKEGQGKPLLLVHGNGEDHIIFDRTVEELKDHFTCYCIDSRGHGQSSPVDEYHYQDMADDMDEFIRTLDLKEVTFCGFSDGGIIGLLLAMKNSSVKNLIVCGANLEPSGVKRYVNTIMSILYKISKDPKIKLMLSEPSILEADLAKIHARTLVLAGEKDLIRYEHTKTIAKSIPKSMMFVLKGEGHGSYIVHNTKLGKMIKIWMGCKG